MSVALVRWVFSDRADWPEAIDAAVQMIRRGGVVACPTETLYGLAVDPRQAAAVLRLFDVKGRDTTQALPLVACDLEQVEAAFGPLSPLALRLAQAFWPGPLTLVLPASDALAPEALAGGCTVAVRATPHPTAAALAARFGYPITATSANLSGLPPTDDPDEVARALDGRIDGLLDVGRTAGGPPSTIVDVTSDQPRLVRNGVLPWSRVVQFLST